MKQLHRRDFLKHAGLGLAGTTLFPRLGKSAEAAFQGLEKSKPNILVILADDLGYGELSCQGFTSQIPTPHIDSIAKNGIRFTSGYVSGPYCSPTRAGFMTGRYQQRFGHEFNPGPPQTADHSFGLPLTEKTFGDRTKAAGYATAWIGKSHLGYEPAFLPQQRGFDEYFGFLGGAHSYLDVAADGHDPIVRGTTPVNNIEYTTDAFGQETVNFIEKHKAEPWFCYLAFNAVHAPLESTAKYLSRFTSIAERNRRTYSAMESAMDDAVGAVLAKLREHHLEENTLIFFFSDNGGPTKSTTSGNGPLRAYKMYTYEGGIRVPFMMQWKGHLPAGKVDDRPVIQLDILATALAAAGVEIKPEWKLDGVNLLPYLTGQKSGAPHEALYWRFGQQMAIRKGDWKLVRSYGCKGVVGIEHLGPASTDGAELYNLAKDIGEKNNLAEQEPAKFRELAAAWDKWNSELVEPKWFPLRPSYGVGKSGKAGKKAGKAGKGSPDRVALFDSMDKNHDGKMSFEEFMANRPDPPAAKKLFEQWDAGKKGFLTREEFITRGGK